MNHGPEAERALRTLAHWGDVFARWQLAGNPDAPAAEHEAVADAATSRLLRCAELHALLTLLEVKGIIGPLEYDEHLTAEAQRICDRLTQRFPGFHAEPAGIVEDLRAVDTLEAWSGIR